MNLQQKNEWVAALRSGDYKQTKGVLARDAHGNTQSATSENAASYCCLGVLLKQQKMADFGDSMSNELKSVNLNPGDLVIMNDAEGCSFDQIADFIEENYREGA